MRKPLIQLAICLPLLLPIAADAQPREPDGGDLGPDRERPHRPERPDRGDMRERPGHDDKNKQRGRITVQRINEAFDTIRELHPDGLPKRLEMLQRAIEENPQRALGAINRFPRIYELMEMRKHQPDEFKLHVDQIRHTRQVFKLMQKLRQAREDGDEPKIAKTREGLRERMRDIFRVRLAMKRIEIERMKERLRQAEVELVSLEANSEKLIEEKLQELEKRGPGNPREQGDRPPPPHDRGDGERWQDRTPDARSSDDRARDRVRDRIRERAERERAEPENE